MGNIQEREEVEPSSVLMWMRWLTVVWLILLIVALWHAKPCSDTAPWWHLQDRYVGCLSPNELGDFLAGAFAPLAFFWLVATVLVQSEELGAQRRELQLTRQEFELSRQVADETRKEIAQQAAAARESAAYVGVQTDILKHQFEQQRKQDADREFDALLNQLETLFVNRIDKRVRVFDQNGLHAGGLYALGPLPGDRDDVLVQQSAAFIRGVNKNRSRLNSREVVIPPDAWQDLRALSDLLGELVKRTPQTSSSNAILARTMRLDMLYRAARDLIATVPPIES